MKLVSLFRKGKKVLRRDDHPNSIKVRMLKGDYKALKMMAKSHHIPAIRLLHQFMVMGCSAAIFDDIMKHEERRKLIIALCQGGGIKPSNLDKIIPKEESPGESPDAAAH